jgi:dienelactone hydrolase
MPQQSEAVEITFEQEENPPAQQKKKVLNGILTVPKEEKNYKPNSMVIFAHGSGSSGIKSPRNQYVAHVLNESGYPTLLVDLLTAEEQKIDNETRKLRFDIRLLGSRVSAVTDWVLQRKQDHDGGLSFDNIGYFGASTGAAASLLAASDSLAKYKDKVKAIVSRGGRPDLAGSSSLKNVQAATLLIVGGIDIPTLAVNQKALQQLKSAQEKRLVIVPGAGHLFEEKGTLEEAAKHAASWFEKYLLF